MNRGLPHGQDIAGVVMAATAGGVMEQMKHMNIVRIGSEYHIPTIPPNLVVPILNYMVANNGTSHTVSFGEESVSMVHHIIGDEHQVMEAGGSRSITYHCGTWSLGITTNPEEYNWVRQYIHSATTPQGILDNVPVHRRQEFITAATGHFAEVERVYKQAISDADKRLFQGDDHFGIKGLMDVLADKTKPYVEVAKNGDSSGSDKCRSIIFVNFDRGANLLVPKNTDGFFSEGDWQSYNAPIERDGTTFLKDLVGKNCISQYGFALFPYIDNSEVFYLARLSNIKLAGQGGGTKKIEGTIQDFAVQTQINKLSSQMVTNDRIGGRVFAMVGSDLFSEIQTILYDARSNPSFYAPRTPEEILGNPRVWWENHIYNTFQHSTVNYRNITFIHAKSMDTMGDVGL